MNNKVVERNLRLNGNPSPSEAQHHLVALATKMFVLLWGCGSKISHFHPIFCVRLRARGQEEPWICRVTAQKEARLQCLLLEMMPKESILHVWSL